MTSFVGLGQIGTGPQNRKQGKNQDCPAAQSGPCVYGGALVRVALAEGVALARAWMVDTISVLMRSA